jgi:uncharacterized membrane protein YhaH (DUF805 family)
LIAVKFAVMNSPAETVVIERIRQLGEKSIQLLLFLSFAFVAMAALKGNHAVTERQQHALTMAMRWWVWALVPALAGVVPLRDFAERSRNNHRWYERIRWLKVTLLCIAIVLILVGVVYFGLGIWRVGTATNVPQM